MAVTVRVYAPLGSGLKEYAPVASDKVLNGVGSLMFGGSVGFGVAVTVAFLTGEPSVWSVITPFRAERYAIELKVISVD